MASSITRFSPATAGSETGVFSAAADRGVMFNLRFPDDEDEGKWLFRNLEPKLRQALCVHWETCQKLNKGKYENEGELAAITILSVLMVKIGLKRFCKCE
jgi:hypothetical protein